MSSGVENAMDIVVKVMSTVLDRILLQFEVRPSKASLYTHSAPEWELYYIMIFSVWNPNCYSGG